MSQSQKFEMPSGATLVITVASFSDALGLTKAAMKCLKGIELSKEDLELELDNAAANPAIVALLLDRLIEFATSPEVESAFWKCAQRALYIPAGSPVEFPGNKVDPSLFEDVAVREDYAKVMSSIVEVNCKPFLAKALFGFLKPKMELSSKNHQ